MLIAQITDMHIRAPGRLAYGRVDTAASLRAVVAAILALDPAPDVVVATGDLVDVGTVEEYAHLREILAPLEGRLLPVMGNHDSRDGLRHAFAHLPFLPRAGFVQYAVEDHPVRLLVLDSHVPGAGGGALCDQRLAWLEDRLAEDRGRPVAIFLHHPPFVTGIAAMDAIGLAGAEALAAVVRRYPNVERILCGHLHRPIQARFAGTIASCAPSTAHQVELDLGVGRDQHFMLEPPGYQLHLYRPDVGLISHIALVGDFAGPYPFFDAEGRLIV